MSGSAGALGDGRRHGKLVADYSLPVGTVRGSSALKVFVRLRPSGNSSSEGVGAPLLYSLKDTGGIVLQAPSALVESDETRDLNDGASISKLSTAPSRPNSARSVVGGGVPGRDAGAERVGLESVGGRGTVDHVYSFSRIFDIDADQDEVFRIAASDVVQHAFRGYHACIFAYGQTGSGKTHTMYGPDGGDGVLCAPHSRGVIPRAADALFAEALTRAPFCDSTIRASLLEIYCDKIRDLGAAWDNQSTSMSDRDRGGGRAPNSPPSAADNKTPAEAVAESRRKAALALRTSELHNRAANERHGTIAASDRSGLPARYAAENLELHEDPAKAVFVRGLTTHSVNSAADVMSLINGGFRLRATHETRMNAVSSRSHTVLSLTVTAADRGTGQTTVSTIHFVDLAGSERLTRSESTGQRLAEAQAINLSLTCLGKVVSALGAGAQGAHVPFRDSKLTRLLSPALGGSSYTTLIATLHARAIDADECLSTLAFAARCQAVVLRPRINVVLPGAEDVALRLRSLESEATVLRHRLVTERLAGSLRIMRLLADAGVAGVLRPGGLFEVQPQNVRIGITHADALNHPFVRRATSMLVAEPTDEDLEIYDTVQEQRGRILDAIAAARDALPSRPGSANSIRSRPSSARGEAGGGMVPTRPGSRPGSAREHPGSASAAASASIMPLSLTFGGSPLTDEALTRAIDAANGSLSTLPGGGLHPATAGVGKGGGFVTALRPLAVPATAATNILSSSPRPSSAVAAAASPMVTTLYVPPSPATVLSLPTQRPPSPNDSTRTGNQVGKLNRVHASPIPKSQLPVFGSGSSMPTATGGIRVAVTPLSSLSPQKSPSRGQTQVMGVTNYGISHGSSPPKWSAIGGVALGAAPVFNRGIGGGGGSGGNAAAEAEFLGLKNRLREVKKELSDMTDQRDQALARLSGVARAGRVKEAEHCGVALEAVRISRDKISEAERLHKKQLEAVLEGSNTAKDAAARVAMDMPREVARALCMPTPSSPKGSNGSTPAMMPLGRTFETMHDAYNTALRRAQSARESDVAALAQAGMLEREALSSAIYDARAATRNMQDAALRREHALRADVDAARLAVTLVTQRALIATARATAAESGLSFLSPASPREGEPQTQSARSPRSVSASSTVGSRTVSIAPTTLTWTTTGEARPAQPGPVSNSGLLVLPFRNPLPGTGLYPGGRPASASSAVLAMKEAAIEVGSTSALLKTVGSGLSTVLATSVSNSVQLTQQRKKEEEAEAEVGNYDLYAEAVPVKYDTAREGLPPPSPLRIQRPPPELSIRIPGATTSSTENSTSIVNRASAIEIAARARMTSLLNKVGSGTTTRLSLPIA